MQTDDKYFDGYSEKALIFLDNLKKNNNREWFKSNKIIFDTEIKQKSQLLISELQHLFAAEDLPFGADIKKSLFRIYRDMRFGKNKLPYKTNTGLFFPYRAESGRYKPVEATGLYLHIEPKGCFIAGGLYRPLPEQLKGIRKKLSNDWEEFSEIITEKNFSREFPIRLQDDKLKRVPTGYPKEHPASEYLKLKGYTAFCELEDHAICERSLIDIIKTKARAIMPFLDFLHQGAFVEPYE